MTNRPMAYSTIMAMQSANSREFRGALASLAADNTAKKRRRMARQQAARIAHANLRPEPGTLGETKRPCDVPVTFKAAKPERRRVVREATPTAPEPVKAEDSTAPEYRPMKLADLPWEARELAKVAKSAGKLSREWFQVGAVQLDAEDESTTVRLFARLHGNSVRYAVAA